MKMKHQSSCEWSSSRTGSEGGNSHQEEKVPGGVQQPHGIGQQRERRRCPSSPHDICYRETMFWVTSGLKAVGD